MIFDTETDIITSCASGTRAFILSLDSTVESVTSTLTITGPMALYVCSSRNGHVFTLDLSDQTKVNIYYFTKNGGGVISYGAPYSFPSQHGLGSFSEINCKEGTTFCFLGVSSTGTQLQYKVDTSVPGYGVTTYPIGAYQTTCKADKNYTLLFGGSTNSIYSMSDYSKTSSNVIKVSPSSATYTSGAVQLMIPKDSTFFLVTKLDFTINKVDQETLLVLIGVLIDTG